jgi:putative ABC transport system permease protein
MQSDPLRQRFKPLVYVPFAQEATPVAAYFLLRTAAAAGQVAEAVRAEVHAVDGDAQLSTFGSLADSFAFDRDRMDAEHSELGKHATVAPVFAAIALLLAAGGLVAVMAHAVGQRTTEVAIRMAVGAAAADIGRMLVRDGMRPVVPGVIVGLAASIGIARVLRSQLVGVSPHDPVTFGAAAVLLLAVALVACYLPARRAMRVDPAIALRHH